MWYGLLNLENLYGTQESLMKTFQEALQSNEPLPLYHKLAGIYLLTEKKDVRLTFDMHNRVFDMHNQIFFCFCRWLSKSTKLCQRSFLVIVKCGSSMDCFRCRMDRLKQLGN